MDTLTVAVVPQAGGHFTYVKGLAAEDWRLLPNRPLRERVPIVMRYRDRPWPVVCQYYEGRFRNQLGSVISDGYTWAYFRLLDEEPVHGAEGPPVEDVVVPPYVQRIIDGLKMEQPTFVLQKAIDASQFNVPSEGVPEDS